MKYPTEDSVDGLFAGDIDLGRGGCLIECSNCDTEVISTEEFGVPLFCTKCNKELHYQRHWDW
jgi:hypothetical protein